MLKYYHYLIPNTKDQIIASISTTSNNRQHFLELNHESMDPGKKISIHMEAHFKRKKYDLDDSKKIIPSKWIKVCKEVIDARNKLLKKQQET